MSYDNESDNTVKLTRTELYEQVWTTSTVQLANSYGISDVFISRICKKHKIPKPPLGYWARKHYGYKVSRKPLPTVGDPRLEVIYMPKRSAPEKPTERPTLVIDQIASEKYESNRIMVSERIDSPHPLIERTERSLKSAMADERGIVRPKAKACLDVSIGKNSVDRAMRIMDALVKALEARGYPVTVADKEH